LASKGGPVPVQAALPLVSIIVAVRNAASTLERTLLSAAAQTYANKEIVVIDGASTDGTMEVAHRFGKVDTLLSEKDSGIPDAYNKGIRLAKGEWIYFLNADDVFARDSVLDDIFATARYEGIDLVVGKVVTDQGKILSGRYNWRLLLRNNVHHQAIFYRAKVLRKLEYNTQYKRYGHDHEHNLLLWRAHVPIAYLDIVVTVWALGGISDGANWKDYKQEFRVRRNAVGRMSWFWNWSTVARYLWKSSRRALQSGRPQPDNVR
jgi:putative colanic acid biosynthesis glycosyltransferase